ncbi:head-tail adaptor protein [Crateriforma conspicua]|uniref:head-tail adaptor protein n=1 Tax=Crateriforma conspicua TaxID=2527996 RepID=UPI0039656A86
MPSPAGKLNHRIVIESPVKTRKPNGQVIIDSWRPLHRGRLPASYQVVSGGETVRGVRMESTTKILMHTRYVPKVNTECRVRWITGADAAAVTAGDAEIPILHLSAVDDPDGLRFELMLQCRVKTT